MALYKHTVEQRLRESESRLREVLENSLDASYKLNLKSSDYDYLSPVIFQITGYTPDEMKTFSIETLKALIHPDDQAEADGVISESLSEVSSSAYHMEYRFRHKMGHFIWLHNQFTIMRDAKGLPLASIGVVRDITQRKHNEEQRNILISDLQKALSEVKTLQGLLPICAHCKNIRDDKGYWNKIESYIHKHSGVDFTHGICPECAKKYYQDMGLFVDKQN
jgi:PAS domain S-box-containing protein